MDFQNYKDWDWNEDVEADISQAANVFIMAVAGFPVFLFFSLWAWLGWRLFINN